MIHWFFDTPGIGSITVFVVATLVFLAYVRMLRWIQTTPPDSTNPDEARSLEGDGRGGR